MGRHTSREALALRWAELCHDATFDDLPYKIELNAYEIRSPSNTDAEMAMKTRAYLGAGAIEVWLVDDAGAVERHDASGPDDASRYGVQLVRPPVR